MGVVVTIKGDFRGVPVEQIEQYAKALIAESTGEEPGRVVHHGVVQTRLDEVRRALQLGEGRP